MHEREQVILSTFQQWFSMFFGEYTSIIEAMDISLWSSELRVCVQTCGNLNL